MTALLHYHKSPASTGGPNCRAHGCIGPSCRKGGTHYCITCNTHDVSHRSGNCPQTAVSGLMTAFSGMAIAVPKCRAPGCTFCAVGSAHHCRKDKGGCGWTDSTHTSANCPRKAGVAAIASPAVAVGVPAVIAGNGLRNGNYKTNPVNGSVIVSSGICLVSGKDIILVRDQRNNFDFSGGMIDHGEDAETAAKRETLEETRTVVDIRGSLAGLSFVDINGNKQHRTYFKDLGVGKGLCGSFHKADMSRKPSCYQETTDMRRFDIAAIKAIWINNGHQFPTRTIGKDRNGRDIKVAMWQASKRGVGVDYVPVGGRCYKTMTVAFKNGIL